MLSQKEYRSKVLGCWMGKNIGGTLGAPFEWHRQVNDVQFYTQDLGGEPMPNDDLDIQLLWLIMLEEQGLDVTSAIMADYWIQFVTPHWAEYGNSKVNMRAGIQPPYSGMRNNYFKHSCGAWIRSEIWACIAPGRPDLAARFAYEDASIDHGDGEGTYAAMFCAALESAAFVEKDIAKLIDIGLSYIPEDCGTAKAVKCAIDSHKSGLTWLDARHKILEDYRGNVFYGNMNHISQADVDRGFTDGEPGWDAPSNIGILIIGLLYGGQDFSQTMCITVNCGEDTDCTGATIGALYGILYGIESIPEKWITPIGRSIKTITLNLGDLGYFGSMVPGDIDNLTDRTQAIMCKMAAIHGLPVEVPAPKPVPVGELYANKNALSYVNTPALRRKFPFFDVSVEYVDGVSVKPGQSAKLKLTIANRYRTQAGLTIKCYNPDYYWQVLPAQEFKTFIGVTGHDYTKTIDLEFCPQNIQPMSASHRFVLEITVDGRASVMHIPVILVVDC